MAEKLFIKFTDYRRDGNSFTPDFPAANLLCTAVIICIKIGVLHWCLTAYGTELLILEIDFIL